jgi:hypothetical protein
MSLLPRVRLALARRPWLYWLAVGLCAAGVWFGVAGAQAQVAHARDGWGRTRRVWVADGDVAAGAAVHATAADYPVAMLPSSALTSAPGEAMAARSVADGEVLVADDLADDRSTPTGWLAFAVPADGAPALLVGDHVAVFGSGERWCDGIVAAATGAVDGMVDVMVEVAVPPDCASALSAQLALDAVTLARTG